jgi:hypothetical protein
MNDQDIHQAHAHVQETEDATPAALGAGRVGGLEGLQGLPGVWGPVWRRPWGDHIARRHGLVGRCQASAAEGAIENVHKVVVVEHLQALQGEACECMLRASRVNGNAEIAGDRQDVPWQAEQPQAAAAAWRLQRRHGGSATGTPALLRATWMRQGRKRCKGGVLGGAALGEGAVVFPGSEMSREGMLHGWQKCGHRGGVTQLGLRGPCIRDGGASGGPVVLVRPEGPIEGPGTRWGSETGRSE